MKNRLKRFTLIELVIVIAVLGILAAILIPNISDFQEKANVSAIKSNTRNNQTASDMYRTDNNNAIPTVETASIGVPKAVNYDVLLGDYVRQKPKTVNSRYWLDANGTAWGSTVDAPDVTKQDKTTGTVEWTPALGSKSCDVYVESENKDKSNLLKMYKSGVTSPFTGEADHLYYVACEDAYGLSSPPVGPLYEPIPSVSPNPGSVQLAMKVGDYVTMGEYNGIPLKWRIVNEDSNGFMLFNVNKVINGMKFDETSNSIWSESSIRNHLNNDLFNTLFTAEQQSKIKTVTHDTFLPESRNELATSGSQEIGWFYANSYSSYNDEGNDFSSVYRQSVQDKLFLPSIDEVADYIYPYYSWNGDKTNQEDLDLYDGRNAHKENTFLLRNYDIMYKDETSILTATPDSTYDLKVGTIQSSDSNSWIQPLVYVDKSTSPKAGDGTRINSWIMNQENKSLVVKEVSLHSDLTLPMTEEDSGYVNSTQTFDITIPAKQKQAQIEFDFIDPENNGSLFSFEANGEYLNVSYVTDASDENLKHYMFAVDKLEPGTYTLNFDYYSSNYNNLKEKGQMKNIRLTYVE